MATLSISEKAKLVAALVATAAVFGLTGCSGGSETSGATESGSGSSEGSSAEDEDDDDSAGCLIGDWVATESGLVGWYRSFVPDEGVIVEAVTGEILLSFSDTDFIYSTRDLTVAMTIGEQAATTKFTGGVAGTYLAFTDGLMSTIVDTSDFDARASVSGIELSASELGIDVTGAGAFSGYECTGGNLLLETQSAGSGTAKIELEPAG